MKLSARNVLKGRVVKVIRGQTTAHVKIDVGGGSVVTAVWTASAGWSCAAVLRRSTTAHATQATMKTT